MAARLRDAADVARESGLIIKSEYQRLKKALMDRPNSRRNLDMAIEWFAEDGDGAVRIRRTMANAIVGQLLPDGAVKGGARSSLDSAMGLLASQGIWMQHMHPTSMTVSVDLVSARPGVINGPLSHNAFGDHISGSTSLFTKIFQRTSSDPPFGAFGDR